VGPALVVAAPLPNKKRTRIGFPGRPRREGRSLNYAETARGGGLPARALTPVAVFSSLALVARFVLIAPATGELTGSAAAPRKSCLAPSDDKKVSRSHSLDPYPPSVPPGQTLRIIRTAVRPNLGSPQNGTLRIINASGRPLGSASIREKATGRPSVEPRAHGPCGCTRPATVRDAHPQLQFGSIPRRLRTVRIISVVATTGPVQKKSRGPRPVYATSCTRWSIVSRCGFGAALPVLGGTARTGAGQGASLPALPSPTDASLRRGAPVAFRARSLRNTVRRSPPSREGLVEEASSSGPTLPSPFTGGGGDEQVTASCSKASVRRQRCSSSYEIKPKKKSPDLLSFLPLQSLKLL